MTTHPFPWKEADQCSVVDAKGDFVCVVADEMARMFLVRAANHLARVLAVKEPLHALPQFDAAGRAD